MNRNDLSKTEWYIMKICWEKGESTARVVYEEALKDKKWSYQTVKTMLDRLVVKGYLTRKKFGPLWLYNPAVPRRKVITKAIDNFVNTVLDNTFAPFLMHFIEQEKFSQEEITALEKFIKRSKEK